MEKHRLTCILVITAVLLTVSPITALAANYGVAGGDYATRNNSYGTSGSNYVMSAPALADFHVNSVYVMDSNNPIINHAEVGWVWMDGDTYPYNFAAWYDNGYYGAVGLADITTPGTNHTFRVKNVLNTNRWNYYYDGTQVYWRTYSTAYRKGNSVCSAERNALGDSNYGHFWGLSQMNSGGTWSNWTNLVNFVDNDPNYYLNKISNTECYMQQ